MIYDFIIPTIDSFVNIFIDLTKEMLGMALHIHKLIVTVAPSCDVTRLCSINVPLIPKGPETISSLF
jgi:hypothetical protein